MGPGTQVDLQRKVPCRLVKQGFCTPSAECRAHLPGCSLHGLCGLRGSVTPQGQVSHRCRPALSTVPEERVWGHVQERLSCVGWGTQKLRVPAYGPRR